MYSRQKTHQVKTDEVGFTKKKKRKRKKALLNTRIIVSSIYLQKIVEGWIQIKILFPFCLKPKHISKLYPSSGDLSLYMYLYLSSIAKSKMKQDPRVKKNSVGELNKMYIFEQSLLCSKNFFTCTF